MPVVSSTLAGSTTAPRARQGAADAIPAEPLDASSAGGSPLWIVNGAWGTDDRRGSRRLLSDRYDGYARVVVRTLAEQPGLRGADATADLVADLVALLAYHTPASADAVNGALRTGRNAGPDDREALLARSGSGAADAPQCSVRCSPPVASRRRS